MCYENDDPSKPIRIQIVGSRWRKDKLMGKQAVYVIRHAQGGNDGEYDTTEFTSAHEEDPEVGWSLGWDCPPPVPEQQGWTWTKERLHTLLYIGFIQIVGAFFFFEKSTYILGVISYQSL